MQKTRERQSLSLYPGPEDGDSLDPVGPSSMM